MKRIVSTSSTSSTMSGRGWQPQKLSIHEGSRLAAPLQSSKPVFYTHNLCPYAARVLLTLLSKDLASCGGFELVHIDLSHKPSWYRQLNPRGLVPAVDFNGSVHIESLDICRWLDDAFPQPALTPAMAAARGQMDALMSSTSGIIASGLELCAGSTAASWSLGRRPNQAQQRRFEQQTRQLADALHQLGGPFLAGPQLSLADIAVFPFMERFELALQLNQDYELSQLHGGALSEWMAHMRSLPCCATASPDEALFRAALQQHQSFDFFDFTTYDAFVLHPHLKQPAAPSNNSSC